MSEVETNKKRFTPKTIGDKKFNIPLYQRLFEWEETQIAQLLNDLFESFKKDPPKPYYIGMLTVYKNGDKLDLVDGQQRFTVMMLMGIVFGWEDFIKFEKKSRLHFFAREQDKKYLDFRIDMCLNTDQKNSDNTNTGYINNKMEQGIATIEQFVEQKIQDKTKIEDFKTYIHENMTFFISYLPNVYKTSDLNLYFEAMNATGKGLEHHEILKVELLKGLKKIENENLENEEEKRLENKNQVLCTQIWNLVSDMSTSIFDNKIFGNKKENQKEIELIVIEVSEILKDGWKDKIKEYLKVQEEKSEDNTISIKDIKSSSENPKQKNFYAIEDDSIITFSEFLLLVLSLQKGQITFNTNKLLETFEALAEKNEIEQFFYELIRYRILFDYYIIKINRNEQRNVNYSLEISDAEQESVDCKENEIKNKSGSKEALIQYQSMLYVSTGYHIWLPEILHWISNEKGVINPKELLEKIKTQDNKRRELKELRYGKIDRYWFWRLDYYLWEMVQQTDKCNEDIKEMLGEDTIKTAIKKYVFRPNRSIEHLYPQSAGSGKDWIHDFGNLAMISSSFNSSQGNDSIGVKFARIEDQLNRGNLESIKLLCMYCQVKKEPNWVAKVDDNQSKGKDEFFKKFVKDHGDKMHSILKNSLSQECRGTQTE